LGNGGKTALDNPDLGTHVGIRPFFSARATGLASADDWQSLCQIRNQFTHDYPDNPNERFQRWRTAVHAASQVVSVLTRFQNKIKP
jgi:hypothetical protein